MPAVHCKVGTFICLLKGMVGNIMLAAKEVRETLEIDKIVSKLASEARSELGVEMIGRQEPFVDADQLLRRQKLLQSFKNYQSVYGDIPWLPSIYAVVPVLEEATRSGILAGEELLKIRSMLVLAGRIREAFIEAREEMPELNQISKKIRDFSQEISDLAVIDDAGRLYDSASPKLRDLREKIDGLRRRIRKQGNDIINGNFSRMLQERVLSLRNGRYTMLVRQEFTGRFPGIITDRSSSGNSVYMEPDSIVSLNNRLATFRQDELEEERRILRELTGSLMARRGAIREAQDALGMADMLYALSQYMDIHKWILPDIVTTSSFKFYGIKHPLLGAGAVPIDIYCGGTFRVLVITGPNTGGKTVALKTAGVGVYLSWCGFPISAVEGSFVGDISSIYTDIGDEQSIEQSLSTFSSHLKNVIDMLRESDDRSLVLLDELGAGTDPQEGAALGVALLKTLRDRRSLVLATTHHNPIKKFATTSDGVETASVDFDLEKLAPTYHLVMGIPGQSNAISIAEKLGMPANVLEEARVTLSSGEASVESMISELQKKSLTLEAQEERLSRERSELDRMSKELAEAKKKIERIRRKALVKASAESERIIEEANRQARDMLRKLDETAKSAVHREMNAHKKEIGKTKERARIRRTSLEAVDAREKGDSGLSVGDTVQIIGSGTAGEILSISGKKASVQMGPMRVEVPLSKLVSSKKQIHPEINGATISVERPVGVASSIMVRGMTIDEAMPMVRSYLDRALLAGYGEVSVIHGKGEGILRRKVHELCRKLKYVDSFRLGENGEGGYGVTIVRFK